MKENRERMDGSAQSRRGPKIICDICERCGVPVGEWDALLVAGKKRFLPRSGKKQLNTITESFSEETKNLRSKQFSILSFASKREDEVTKIQFVGRSDLEKLHFHSTTHRKAQQQLPLSRYSTREFQG